MVFQVFAVVRSFFCCSIFLVSDYLALDKAVYVYNQCVCSRKTCIFEDFVSIPCACCYYCCVVEVTIVPVVGGVCLNQ